MASELQRPGRKAVTKALKSHSRAKITQATIEAHGASLQHESDRGTVIMTAAMIEDTLTQSITEQIGHLKRREIDDLFDFNGPMGTFSNKIKCAQAFKIIDSQTRAHIEIIREMRNACAHSQHPLTFKDDALRNAVFTMLDDESVESYREDFTFIRMAFVMLTATLASIIMEGDVQKGTARVNAIIEQYADEIHEAKEKT